MSQRYGRKIAGRRAKKDESQGCDFHTFAGFSKDSSEPFGIREGGDGQASPVNEWPDISDDGELPLTIHSVAVGGVDNAKFGNELGGITDRISKLLNEYEEVYDDESSQRSIGASFTGQIYLDNLLSDYYTLCQEREEVLESLHDSLDLDEDEILDRLERMTKKSKDDLEGSDLVVKETFEQAKHKFERLKELNKEMMLLSRQDQDLGKLEEEKNQLQEELLQYQRMAVQQKMGSFSETRRKSLLQKDESLQWKLVAGEMLDIVKGIKLEGKTDKVQLEKDLNMILLGMGGLNEQIDKLKAELLASESNVKKLQKEKASLQEQKTMKEQELKDKVLEVKNCKKLVKKLEEEKKQEAEKALAKEQEDIAKAKEKELKRPDILDDTMQAQLRDQKNKIMKMEEQNKELLARIESYQQEEQERKEIESNLAQTLSIPGMADCSTCQVLGRQVLTSREEISLLSSKVEELEQQLAELRDKLTQAQEELENVMKSQVDVIKRREVIEGQEATSGTPSPTQEVSSKSLENKESPESEKPRRADKQARKQIPRTKTESKKKAKEAKSRRPEVKTIDDSSKTESEESKSEEEIQETLKRKAIEGTEKEEMEMGGMGIEERRKEDEKRKEGKPRKEKKTEKEGEDKDRILKGVGSRHHEEENVSYVKVREAKMITLCDTGTQTGNLDRLAGISMAGGSRRSSLISWKASKDRKHSLADAIMSNAPPNVIEQETSIAASVICEEAERLCEDICDFMEYSYDLIDQEEKILESQAAKHLGEEKGASALKESTNIVAMTSRTRIKDMAVMLVDIQQKRKIRSYVQHVQGLEHDTLRTSDRRQSVFTDVLAGSDLPPAVHKDAFPSRDRRQSVYSESFHSRDRQQSIHGDVFPTRDRRQSIHTADALPTRDSRQSIHIADALPTRDRRQSIHTADASPVLDRQQNLYGDGTPAGDRTRRLSTILQLDLHRDGPMNQQHGAMQHGAMQHGAMQHGTMATERIGLRIGADVLQKVEDETVIADKKHEFLRRGEGAKKLPEARIKKQIASMAQTAINIIKDTGDAFQYQLNEKLGYYEKFYDLWRETRKARRMSVRRSPVAGIGMPHDRPQQERSVKDVKSREEQYEMEETDVLLPLLSQESKEKSLEQGLMLIGASSKSEPKTPPPQLPPPRKRGKPRVMTRQQQMIKQKALLEKARHVEAKADTRILTVKTARHSSPGSPHHAPKEGQHKSANTSLNQTFNLPFIAHGLGKHEEPTDKKTAIARRMSTADNLQKSLPSWNTQGGIQKYFSANDVPAFKSEIKTSFRAGRKNKSKLPTLNISNLFGSF